MLDCHRWDKTLISCRYFCGLIQAESCNMERTEESVLETEYQSIVQFISDHQWDHRDIMDRVALEADILLGGNWANSFDTR